MTLKLNVVFVLMLQCPLRAVAAETFSIPTRAQCAPLVPPNEKDGNWKYQDGAKTFHAETGGQVLVSHSRRYSDLAGERSLEVVEVLGQVVLKAWSTDATRDPVTREPADRIVALQDENGVWCAANVQQPVVTLHVDGNGLLQAVSLILTEADATPVLRRLLPRH